MGWFNSQIRESEKKDKAELLQTYRDIDESLKAKNALKLDGKKLEKVSTTELVRFTFKYIKKSEILILVVLTAVTVALGFALPELTHYLVSDVPAAGDFGMLKSAILWISLATVFICILSTVRQIIRAVLGNGASQRACADVMQKLLKLPADFFRDYSDAELATRLAYIEEIINEIFSAVFDNVIEVLMSLVYLTEVAKYAPSMILASAILIVVTMTLSFITGMQRARVFKVCLETSVDESSKFSELLDAIQKIKTSGADKRAFTVWGKLYEESIRANYNPPFLVRYSGVILNGTSLLGSAIIYLLAALSNMSGSDYFTFLSAYSLMTAVFASLPLVVEQTAMAGAAYTIVTPLLKAEEETEVDLPPAGGLTGSIHIKDLTFSYDGKRNIIENFNLDLKAGDYLAVTGGSGCGKSTLVRLLLGLERPTGGSVCYDGWNMAEVDPVSVRRQIGSVLQGGKLLDDSIKNNVTITNPEMTDEDVWVALDEANIAEDVAKMPMHLETVMNESTGAVSGGQKQRILIARALASRPKILILDEATSALDNISQRKVTETLDGVNCTRIIVAHRLSTIRNCNRIIFMDHGTIVEDGSYEELMKLNGGFAELVKRQQI